MGTSSRIRVLVADGHPVYRQGLVEAVNRRPGLSLVVEAETGTDALEKIKGLKPDVAVIGMRMPGIDGMHVMRGVIEGQLPTRVLFLSANLESATVYEAVQAGARGYISKDRDGESICESIAAVARGQMVMGAEAQEAIAHEIRLRTRETRDEPNPLSERERQILSLTAEGQSSAKIAEGLFLSPATVKTHLQRIYKKLGVSDRAAAVAAALRTGVVK